MKVFGPRDKAFLGLVAVAIMLIGVAIYFSKQQLGGKRDAPEQRSESAYAIKIEKEKTFGGVLEGDPTAYFTRSLAIATWILTIFTACLAIVTIMIWCDGKRASRRQNNASRRALMHSARNARAAQEAADIAAETLIASHRAWIRPQVEIGGSLSFNETGAMFDVSFKLENIGTAPAQSIVCQAWLIPAFDKQRNPNTAAFRQHEAHCAASRQKSLKREGFSLFPNERFPEAQGISGSICPALSREALDAATFEHATSGRRAVSFFVGGAVNYRFASDSKMHQSSFFFELGYKWMPGSFDISKTLYEPEDLTLTTAGPGDGRRAD